MSVTFQVKILNEQNNNSVPIDFHLPSGVIKGKCAVDRKSESVISSTIDESDGRKKTLKFIFRTEEMRVKRVDELRWQLNKVVYVEKYAVYLCERTRKRTLSESLQHRSTVFCGVVLALSSIAHIVGHMLRRHFMPHRKELYENLDRLPAIN
uniref:MSP domain-containing protein n=1 Tax=Caenorhabditis tropicalis TaxID=1561998 RepID=A0A1I7TYP8_9PELO